MEKLKRVLEELGGQRKINYSLHRITAALNYLGNPQLKINTFVIGGTNGKGTVTLLISAALTKAGYKVGTYLSPHLVSPDERFLQNMHKIEALTLEELVLEYEKLSKKFELSYFEFLTLIYYVWAEKEGFDFSVLEVGLGGRLDATNTSDPIASIITTISLDHENYLGKTEESILEEKMGILRKDGLVFTGIEQKNLLSILEKRSIELDSIVYYANGVSKACKKRSFHGQLVSYNNHDFYLTNPSIGTFNNGALAFLFLRIVFPKLSISLVAEAFSSVLTPARFELVSESPRIILSGDHNPEGVLNTIQTLDELNAKKLVVLCAFSPDKNYNKMIELLQKKSKKLLLCSISQFKSKMPPDYFNRTYYRDDAMESIKELLSNIDDEETLLITGSLYFAGELRPIWKKEVEFLKDSQASH